MTPRNVLFICTDQQRKDSLGCYGHPSAATPNLDALAAGGLRCEGNIVANPICMPNRMSMLTGQYPRNHGQWTNGLLLDPLPLTLPEHLRRQGWRTASIGKIHLTPTGCDDDRSYESRQRWRRITEDPTSGGAYAHLGPYAGFEHVELTIGHGGALNAHYEQWYRDRGGTDEMLMVCKDEGVPERPGVRDLPVALHHTTFVAERAEALLERMAGCDAPFFAHVSFPDPHHPFDPPREAAEKVDPAAEPEPIGSAEDLAGRPPHYEAVHRGGWGRRGFREPRYPEGFQPEHARIIRARTTAMVNMIDQGVGRILDTLQRTGLKDSTLVVFTSDHGDMLGDHGMVKKGPFSFRQLLNTPLIVHGPGVAVGVSQRLISDVDLAPTLCEALGAEPMPFADGRSVWDHLQNPELPARDEALLEYRTGFNDYACAMHVTEETTYVRYQDGQEELNDLAADPQERCNHASDQPERCAELRARLLDVLLSTQARGPEQISHA